MADEDIYICPRCMRDEHAACDSQRCDCVSGPHPLHVGGVSVSDAENTTRKKIAAIVHNVIDEIMMSGMHPENVALAASEKVADALIAAFPTLTATGDPDDEQAWIEYMSTDDFLQLIPTPGSMFRAGYRAALAAVVPGGTP